GRTPRTLSSAGCAGVEHHADQRARNAWREGVSLDGGEPAPVDLLKLGQRAPECGEIAISRGRKQRHQHEMRNMLHFALWRLRQRGKRVRLRLAAYSRLAGGNRNDAVPLPRELDARDQRPAPFTVARPPTLDDETTAGKQPGPDRGTLGTPYRQRK